MSHIVELRGRGHAVSDLLLRQRKRADNILESVPYVPGSALRGALAQRWLSHRSADDRFRRIFQSGLVRFEHAYPLAGEVPTRPAPLTLMGCKLDPFGDGHVLRDIALDEGLQLCEADDHGDRPAALKRRRDFVGVEGLDASPQLPGVLVSEDEAMVSRQRIGTLNDGTRRAEQGSLFEERLIARDTRFAMSIVGPREDIDELLAATGLTPHSEVALSVGRSRTVMGGLDVTFEEPVDRRPPAPVEGDRHVLWFTSATVLLDGYQRSVSALGEASVLASEVLACDPNLVKVHQQAVRTTPTGGWDALHGLSKPVDAAIVPGSVVVFSAPDEAVAALAARPGIGWRQAEGLGAFLLDSPVHRVRTWQRPDEARRDSRSDAERRDGIAQRAETMAKELRDHKVSRSTWSGIASAVREGVDPAVKASERRKPDHKRAGEEHSPAHSQSVSGRSGGAADQQREQRSKAVSLYEEAVDDLKLARLEQRVLLVEDVSAELQLLGGQSRQR